MQNLWTDPPFTFFEPAQNALNELPKVRPRLISARKISLEAFFAGAVFRVPFVCPFSLAWLPIWLAGRPQSLAISGPLHRMVVEIVDQALSENEGYCLFNVLVIAIRSKLPRASKLFQSVT